MYQISRQILALYTEKKSWNLKKKIPWNRDFAGLMMGTQKVIRDQSSIKKYHSTEVFGQVCT